MDRSQDSRLPIIPPYAPPPLSPGGIVFLRILDIYRICPKIRLHFCVSLQEQL